MITRYPYIIIGMLMLLAPFALMFAMLGGAAIFLDQMDLNDVELKYDFMNSTNQKILFVYPAYTYYANEENSLVDIGDDFCYECEKFIVDFEDIFDRTYGGVSDVGASVGNIGSQYYNMTNDFRMSEPKINEFDKIVLMRNVYVTETTRELILNHPNVIYMFPDAMTKEISDKIYKNESGLDDASPHILANGSGTKIILTYEGEFEPLHPQALEWADDNRCEDWKFVKVQNGYMMNCTPDIAIINNYEMLKALRDI